MMPPRFRLFLFSADADAIFAATDVVVDFLIRHYVIVFRH